MPTAMTAAIMAMIAVGIHADHDPLSAAPECR
jgi:hypothetical protein